MVLWMIDHLVQTRTLRLFELANVSGDSWSFLSERPQFWLRLQSIQLACSVSVHLPWLLFFLLSSSCQIMIHYKLFSITTDLIDLSLQNDTVRSACLARDNLWSFLDLSDWTCVIHMKGYQQCIWKCLHIKLWNMYVQYRHNLSWEEV